METLLKKGQTLLFQGDSITDCNRDRDDISSLSDGYAGMVAKMYNSLIPDNNITFINKGISGNRVIDLLERYEDDFKAINPDFISILIGINDTWRRYKNNDPTSTESFEKSYRELLANIKKDMPSCKILMIEPFVLNSLPDRRAWREDLDPKINVVRELAKEFADYYLPLDGILAKTEVEEYNCKELAPDGVHPSELGHNVIAEEYMNILTKS